MIRELFFEYGWQPKHKGSAWLVPVEAEEIVYADLTTEEGGESAH